ncbi:hypothetical protein GCM10027271_25550 [Saccharopolyspora gloriosae]|uniref:Peptidoglycan/LPS O-acetylase OafA/YrhL n=1 Tax=Saccharopolyspora gloriosae TaxID=455344 RepID=A0A840NTV6_9PSEU|nr:hypothetical protein [Saccharopolyspora gloriosae]MBB5071607.1 peptidoglycan/LPS O-acetylase OafA/YrhL [Saccharopolyspora gloriosae]
MLLCPVLRNLTVRLWIALPPLFLGAATGVAALLAWPFDDGAPGFELSVPVLLGFAAGLALLTGGRVRWSNGWQRFGLRFGYPVTMFGGALTIDRIQVPLVPMLALGGTALALLAIFLMRNATTDPHCG